ncbi:MAG: hypothetical protein U0X40_08125 [Ferruginibacter sp.]
MNARFGEIRLLLISFAAIMVLIVLGALFYHRAGINYYVVAGANGVFLLSGLLVFNLQRKALNDPNPNEFVRSVMKGVMLKLFICIGAVLAYVLLSGKNVNRPALIISMGIYLVYLLTEVMSISKMNKGKQNG